MIPMRPEWHEDAACRGMDPAIFFTGRSESTAPAKRVCAGCAMRERCLAENIDERYGVFGGLNERERRNARRGIVRDRTPHQCPHGHVYTEENSYRDPKGWLRCRTCAKAASRRVRANRRAQESAG